MIIEQGTIQGTMHKEYSLPNQDAVVTRQIGSFCCAAVCDGVSLDTRHQFSRSEIASSLCASAAIEVLSMSLKDGMSEEQIMNALKMSFERTLKILERSLERQNIPVIDCQTTMIVMILHEGILYTGIAGDGGVFYLQEDGSVGVLVTEIKTSPQVYPIIEKRRWEFVTSGSAENKVIAAMACTDGVFDNLMNWNGADAFVDLTRLHPFLELAHASQEQRHEKMLALIESIKSHDDKTAAVILPEAQDVPVFKA